MMCVIKDDDKFYPNKQKKQKKMKNLNKDREKN